MKKFKIIYKDPESDPDDPKYKTVVEEFTDTQGEYGHISAYMWAEDYAYSLSDKGFYTIEEINE